MALLFTHNYWAAYAALSSRRSDPQVISATRNDFCINLAQLLLSDTYQIAGRPAHAIANCLFERMSDASLFYHTPLHVLSMLAFAQDHGIALDLWQQLAIWFHDAIYSPPAAPGENERNSAMFMRALLRSHLSEDILGPAEAGIEATALYHSPDVDPAFHVILDLDLCNFSWEREGYGAASQNVAQEMIPVYGDERFQAGRNKFLTDMLAKKFIYRTEFFRANCEAQARGNIKQGLLHSANSAPNPTT